jgi:membrane peptidoglycan carboxypeptidase
MGYTTDLAVGVWMGQTTAAGDRFQELPERDGIQGAGPIWADMMLEMHNNPQWASLLTGPNGATIPEDFPVPAGVHKSSVCVSTGHKATSGFQSRQEWLVDGQGPALECNQLSADEYAELQYAENDVRSNGGKYTGRGQDTLRRYADAVGSSGDGGFDSGDDDSASSGDDNSSSGDDDTSGNSPPIVPIDQNNN